MRKILVTYLPASMFLAFLAMVLFTVGGCGGDGGGSVSDTTPSPTPSEKSVVITGTVPGTVAIAYDYATGLEAARNVAGGSPKTFTLNVDPGAYYLMFIENEGAPSQRSYAFRNVTGGNVLTCQANTTLDLGVLVFNEYPGTAVPRIDPVSGNDNVTETVVAEASFSPGDGKWTATKRTVSSTCAGRSPGTTVTETVTIAQGFGLVTYTPDGTNDTAGGVPNVYTVILTGSYDGLETIYLTMQSDGSLAGSFDKAGGGCSEEGTITAVRGTFPPSTATLAGLSINGPSSMAEYGTATYTATASWSDGSTSLVTPTWSVNSQVAEISPGGVLSCQGGVSSDQTVTIMATYSTAGITETASMDVTIAKSSVVITGTVPGTVAIAYDYATGMEAARNVASGTPKTFSLSVAPGSYYLMFLENEGTSTQRDYAFRNVTGGNVITCKANTTLDLGVLVFNIYPGTAVPHVDPISGNENVTETFMPEAIFSPGDGKWAATRTFVSSSCSGHAPGTTVTENVTIAQGFGIVTYTPDGTNETAVGVANVNTAILTGSYVGLETIYLTMQSDGSLAGSFNKVGGGCSEGGTITAVRGTAP